MEKNIGGILVLFLLMLIFWTFIVDFIKNMRQIVLVRSFESSTKGNIHI